MNPDPLIARDPPPQRELPSDNREQTLGASELRYRRLFETSQDGILILDAETGMIMDVNPFLIGLLGYSHETFLGKKVWELGFFKNLIANEANFVELQQKEYLRYEDLPLETADGRRIEVEFISNVNLVNEQKVIQCQIREITARKQAEAALRQSEERYRMVADFTDDWEYWRLPDGSLTYVSPSCERLTGYTAQQFLQDPGLLINVLHPEDRPQFAQHLAEGEAVTADERHAEMEFRILTRSGEERWLGHACRQVFASDGKSLGRRGSNRDITERKQTEAAMRESEGKFRTIFDEAPLGVALINSLTGHIDEVNAKFAEIAGRTRAEMATIDWMSITHPDDVQEDLNQMARLNAGQITGFHMNKRYRRPDGSYVWIHMTIAPITVANRTQPRHMCMIEDIAERKQVEEKLQLAGIYNRSLLEASLDPLVTISVEGKITDLNAATETATGRARAELIGTDFSDYFTDPAKARAGYQQAFREGFVRDYELELRSGINQTTPVLYNATVYRTEKGEVIGVFAAARDITERKRAEHALHESSLELQRKNAELERFLYTASHDLKSPVVTVRTFLGYLEQDLPAGDAGRIASDLNFIRTATEKMAKLLDDLLEMSRVGRVIAPPVRVTFRQLVDDALAAVAGQIAERGVSVAVGDGAATVFGDRMRLAEVLQNLLDNACKFMGDQKAPRIEVGFEARGAETVFFVRDNGIGIDPRFQAKVFGLFEKLDTKAEGSGIGLALVKRIVELHGGRIWVESAGLGQGAGFHFTLPGAVGTGE